jgi:uncharacterized membrane protein YfcA
MAPGSCNSVGALVGTLIGRRLLQRIPEPIFHRIVSALILAVGVALFWKE